MTGEEVEGFIARLLGLWPDKMTPEQADIWRAYIGKLSAQEAGAALTHYAANEMTATPKVAKFRAAVEYLRRESGAPAGTRCHPDDHELTHTIRHLWMKADPDRAGFISAMPPDEIELTNLRNLFYGGVLRNGNRWGAISVYGPSHHNTIRAFKDWQRKAAALGYPTITLEQAVEAAPDGSLSGYAPANVGFD